jgi:O-antigen ligase
VLPVVAAGAALACAIALYQFPHGIERYSEGWHGGPGSHSSALIALMPCLLVAVWYARRARWPRSRHVTIWALCALFLASAYTTLNRTIWIAFALQVILLGWLLLRRRVRSGAGAPSARTLAFAIVLGIAVLAGGTAVMLLVQEEREAIGAGRAFEDDSRLALWPEVAERIAQRPLTGYGFGRGLLRKPFREEFGRMDLALWHSHNLFFDTVLQTGVPGLLLLIALLGATARLAWQSANAADDAVAAAGMALLGVIAGMLLRNMTDVLWVRQNSLLFWGMVGVLLAWGAPGSRLAPAWRPQR